jgi:hypothetical protein
LDDRVGIDALRRGRDTCLENPADLAANRFDGAQRKTELRDVLVCGDDKVIHPGEDGRHPCDEKKEQ